MRIGSGLSFAALLLGAVTGAAWPQQPRPSQPPAINRAWLDTTCSPCTDFWRFSNGAWLDSARIPPAAETWGRDAEISARNNSVIRALLDSLAFAPERHGHTPLERSVGTFFRACMDSTASSRDELRAMEPELRRLASVGSRTEVSAAIGRLTRAGLRNPWSLFWFFIGDDPSDSARRAGHVRGLYGWTMGRQVYLRADAADVRRRDDFVAMLTTVFGILGDPETTAAANARHVLALETRMARAQPDDSGGANRRYTLADLRQGAGAFDWRAFAEGLGRPDLPPVYIPAAVRAGIDSVMAAASLEEWRAYLRWRYVYAAAPVLRNPLGSVIGGFFFSGGRAMPSLASRCVLQTTWRLAAPVAQAYVARTFSAADREAAVAMTERLRTVFRERVATLEWMGPATRLRAVAKVDSLRLQIGYPDEWEDYSGLVLGEGPAAALYLAALRFHADRGFGLRDGPVDRARWVGAEGAFVDLSYMRSNALLATAAALQPPAFDADADEATNLATIGHVIGHEFWHAFGPTNLGFNEIGVREDWVTPDDLREYQRRLDLVVAQYDRYPVIDSIHHNGRRALGENLVDIGGVVLAWLAYERATAGQPSEVVDGFTREQRFFIALGQGRYRIATRPEVLRSDADNFPYSTPQWRLNGSLANLEAFATAFGCREGDPMVVPAGLRANLW